MTQYIKNENEPQKGAAARGKLMAVRGYPVAVRGKWTHALTHGVTHTHTVHRHARTGYTSTYARADRARLRTTIKLAITNK